MSDKEIIASCIQSNNDLVMLTRQLQDALFEYERQLEYEKSIKSKLFIMLEACKRKEVANA